MSLRPLSMQCASALLATAFLTICLPAAGGLQGDRLPYVPRLSGSLTADYLVPIGGDRPSPELVQPGA